MKGERQERFKQARTLHNLTPRSRTLKLPRIIWYTAQRLREKKKKRLTVVKLRCEHKKIRQGENLWLYYLRLRKLIYGYLLKFATMEVEG